MFVRVRRNFENKGFYEYKIRGQLTTNKMHHTIEWKTRNIYNTRLKKIATLFLCIQDSYEFLHSTNFKACKRTIFFSQKLKIMEALKIFIFILVFCRICYFFFIIPKPVDKGWKFSSLFSLQTEERSDPRALRDEERKNVYKATACIKGT